MLIKITKKELDTLKNQTKQSARKRVNYNFHKVPEDPLQRMLQALNKGTYVQPHKHENPDKREVFLILQGRAAVLAFNDTGEIVNQIVLDHKTENYGVEIPERTWHTIIALEDDTVIYEVKDGPWSPLDDKDFAPWAPKEGESGCMEYLEKLMSQI